MASSGEEKESYILTAWGSIKDKIIGCDIKKMEKLFKCPKK